MRTDPIVQRHLTGIAQLLRGEVAPLDPALAARRAAVLDKLTDYALKGQFPANNVGVRKPKQPVEGGFAQAYENRAPLFVDDAGVHCAVGHLVAASNPALVAKVRAVCNEAWIDEMPVPELAEWAAENGLTMRDVARIQPSYEPAYVPNCEEDPQTYDAGVWDEFAADIAVAPREWPGVECFDGCDGDFVIWIAIDNHGGIDAERVHVKAWSLDNEPLLDERTSIPGGTSVLLGPLTFPHEEVLHTAFFVSATATGNAFSTREVVIGGPMDEMGLGYRTECDPYEPDTGDTGFQGGKPAGCAGACSHNSPSSLVGLSVVGGILGLRRRRAAGGPGDRWAAR